MDPYEHQHLAEAIRQELDGVEVLLPESFLDAIVLNTRAILQAAALQAAVAVTMGEVAQGAKRSPMDEDRYIWNLQKTYLKDLIEQNTEHLNEQPPKSGTAAPPATSP